MLRDAWEEQARNWIAWARAPGHDSYWLFHRDAFLRLVPPPGRLTVDVGCGEGRLGRDLAALGHRVVGLDASPTMVRAAADYPGVTGRFGLADAAALPLATGAADCVVAFMSLQDVDDMRAAVSETGRVLSAGGRLVMAITHPLNTAGRFAPGPEEATRPFVVTGSWFDHVKESETIERDGYTMTFWSAHRPTHDYTDALADAGFLIERLREVTDPRPAEKWHRIPLFLHLRAVRQ